MTSTVSSLRGLAAACSAAGRSRLGAATISLIALALLMPCEAAAAVPGHIRRHEVTRVERVQGPAGRAALRLRVRTFERDFELELEPSPTLSAHAETITIGASGVRREPSAPVLFRGHLADDEAATVRVALAGPSLIGSVTTEGETWFFEPLRRYEAGAAADRTVVYRASDLDASALPPLDCAAEAVSLAAYPGTTNTSGTVSSTPRLHASTLGLVELTLVADYRFFAAHGSDSAAAMQAVIDQVAAFYPADLGVTVSVVQTIIHETAGSELLTTSTQSLALLNSLASIRQTEAATFGAGDITHLFTGRDLDENTIGIAYVGAVCDEYYGVSLSQDFNADLHLLTLLTGHELGHALGAWHDGQASSPCESADYGYVMWPSIQYGLAEQFSTCSQSSIGPVVDSASCIATAVPPDCGDGNLDDGEGCDDGNNAASDCCRGDCQLDPAGTRCSDDGNQCTADVCDGSGVCEYSDVIGSCDDANACTTDGQCAAGSCASVGELVSTLSQRLKTRLRPETDDDSLVFRAVLAAALASPPTVSGATVRFLDDNGEVLHESEAAASLWSDHTGAGRSYQYDNEDAAAPDAAGLATMSVRLKPTASTAKVKLKFADTDLPFLAGRTSVGVQILIGSAISGDCASAVTMQCTYLDDRLSCS